MGQSPSSDSCNASGIGLPFYQGNADFGKEHPVPKVWCDDPKKTALAGDILISVRAPIGAVNIASEKCCIGRGLAAIRSHSDTISQGFLKQQLLARKSLLESKGTGSTFRAVGKKVLLDFPIRLYPLREQVQIEERLKRLLLGISVCERYLAKLDDLRKSRFVEMFGDFRANSFNWQVLAFEQFAKIDTHMTTDFERYADLPHIGIDSIESNTGNLIGYRTVKEDGVRSGKYPFTAKHIIYSKIRPALNKVALPHFSGVCSADAYPILPNDNICDRVFLAYAMRSEYFLDYILPLSTRSRMPKVNKEALSGFEMPLPPLSLQQEFASFVAQVDKLEFRCTGTPDEGDNAVR